MKKLVCGLIRSYNWTDTRDMVADVLTKGSADRSALSAIMDGRYHLHHLVHEYKEPASSATSTGNQNSTTGRQQKGNQDFPTNLANSEASHAHDVIVYEPASIASASSHLCATSGGGACGASPVASLEGGSGSTSSAPRLSSAMPTSTTRRIVLRPDEYWRKEVSKY